MTFLIAKIILMLVLAAALGAWLAWLRWQRRFIEVTTEYHALRDGWAAWRNAIDARLAEPPNLEPQLQAPLAAALAPLVQRLQALEDAVRRLQVAPTSAPPPNAAPGIDAGELAARFHAMQAVLISTLESALAAQAMPAAQAAQAAHAAGAGAAALAPAAAAAPAAAPDAEPEADAAPAGPPPPLHEQVRSGSRNLLQGVRPAGRAQAHQGRGQRAREDAAPHRRVLLLADRRVDERGRHARRRAAHLLQGPHRA
jgi:hypothetical protein